MHLKATAAVAEFQKKLAEFALIGKKTHDGPPEKMGWLESGGIPVDQFRFSVHDAEVKTRFVDSRKKQMHC